MAKKGASSSNPLAKWNAHNISIFCDVCIREVETGHRPVQLNNKWDALKNEWKLWRELVGKETSLGWNSSKGTVDASEEWRNNKIHNMEDCKKKKDISPKMEEKLDTMFSNIVATGEHAQAPSSRVLPQETRGIYRTN
ncbi:hypothetical protein D8674_039606 [Pyrus ussuriensis x Pyrus communis]|uniref:Myb/SANT-like domain-containing protein n=1 Tax=Pyrus ussuriensis x Pyrus communis TaxID=2448454 RepID=A0A5N5H4B7_9ROSA|nr:hypothetical protein D8674_039606 [Pyrus ussuriensis x Pyrus communis]